MSGVLGSMTRMRFGISAWASSSARKRPTQPPPAITMGRGCGEVDAEVPVPFVEPFEMAILRSDAASK